MGFGRNDISKETRSCRPASLSGFKVKGYGFIAPDGGDKDVFVHVSAIEQANLPGLNEGQRVNFEVKSGRDGRVSAENLSVAN